MDGVLKLLRGCVFAALRSHSGDNEISFALHRERSSEMNFPSIRRIFTGQNAQHASTRDSERLNLLVQGAKTALAAGLCYWLSTRFGLHEGYWSAISAIIVLQSNVGSTVTASRDRLIGTAIGAVMGWLASPWARQPLAFALAILLVFLICGSFGLKNSSRLAGVTVTIVMLVQRNGSHWRIAMDRFFEVSMGILVALAVSTFVLPRRDEPGRGAPVPA